jgi:hypothetical protein
VIGIFNHRGTETPRRPKGEGKSCLLSFSLSVFSVSLCLCG